MGSVTSVGRFCVTAFPGGLRWIFMVGKLYLIPELSTLRTFVAQLPECQLRCFSACHRGFFMLRRELWLCCNLAASLLSWSHCGGGRNLCLYAQAGSFLQHEVLLLVVWNRLLQQAYFSQSCCCCCIFFFSSYRCHIKPAGPRDDWKATVQLSATMDIHGWYMMLIPKAGKWSQMHYSHWFFQKTSDAINSMYRTKHISLLLNDACFAHCGKGEGNQVLRAERPSCKFCPQYFYPHHWIKMI